MKSSVRAWALACLLTAATPALLAQQALPGDYIVAVVNSEPITFQELNIEVRRVSQQLTQQGQAAPAPEELRRLVLERMINDKAQLQLAREQGIRMDATAIDRAEQNVASQNGVDVLALRQKLAKDGVTVQSFRDGLRDQLTLSRLHEREVESSIKVSDVDVDRVIQEQQANNTDPFAQELNLAQILIVVPEKANGEEAAALFVKAQRVLQRARDGEDFNKLVQEFSAADRNNGGQIGLRRGDRLPPSFVTATQNLKVGEVSEVVRTGAGFHILKLVERKAPTRLVQTVVQTRARHILLRNSPQLSQAQAIARLADARQQIVSGKTDFASMARKMSQDSSAEQGGDLGWASPGMFVPEFEEAMNRLQDEGAISPPVVSRFGVHLIQLVDKRRVELSPQQIRESVRAQLRQSRYEEAYTAWARDVRARAFVEMREAPQ
ncbi:peptidylprolyl isomerase [Rhodoferax mekongensis]|uniref:peptidylprolyl isomerase n=1 Tax=Rhodoferax mekongensis TaxID=3068341 RepID=UPI0028BD3B0D|nr:peptidylprolyl isomerase [Rhodoferax sp. TBRC 17199]MDT7513675.1 peptidylprolyl isomerase [Rhodoferax sp. TBRC 17199]